MTMLESVDYVLCMQTIISFFALFISLIFLKKYLYGAKYSGKYRLDGKTVIVTGANTGIGKETAKDLSKRGAKVILACRNLSAAKKAAEEIKHITGNSSIIVVKHLNLASLSSVRSFVRNIKASEERLDILINNAGVYYCPDRKTEDGFEMHFGVNHLGHFLLTNLLLDMMKKSAPSRVVTVSSYVYERADINFDDINCETRYNPDKCYSQSKLANVLFSRELARRLHGTGVTTYCLHPGIVRTDVGRYMMQQIPYIKPIIFLFKHLPLFKDAEHGAQTVIYCAVDMSLENETGKYYRECRMEPVVAQALDDSIAKKLWEVSEQMVGRNGN